MIANVTIQKFEMKKISLGYLKSSVIVLFMWNPFLFFFVFMVPPSSAA